MLTLARHTLVKPRIHMNAYCSLTRNGQSRKRNAKTLLYKTVEGERLSQSVCPPMRSVHRHEGGRMCQGCIPIRALRNKDMATVSRVKTLEAHTLNTAETMTGNLADPSRIAPHWALHRLPQHIHCTRQCNTGRLKVDRPKQCPLMRSMVPKPGPQNGHTEGPDPASPHSGGTPASHRT